MPLTLRSLAMPLLGRELVESGNRPRTYVQRCLCALLMLLVFSATYASATMTGSQGLMIFGNGAILASGILVTVFIVVLLLLPLQSAVSVTSEKEQGTLVLLMLTPMGPWQLVVQKWLSRVVTMLSLLLVTLPLFAIAYSYGGLTTQILGRSLLSLLLLIIQVAAVGVAVSCWCRASTTAVLQAYALELILYLAVPLLSMHELSGTWIGSALAAVSPFQLLVQSFVGTSISLSLVMPLVATLAFLLMARLGVVRPGALQPGNAMMSSLRGMDAALDGIESKRRGRGQVAGSLPGTRPVFWRDVNRRTLASPRHLVRVFLPLIAGLIGLVFWIHQVEVIFDLVLTLAVALSVLMGAGAINTERVQQTLEVLLTSPLEAREIVRQKAAALARIRWALSTCLIILALLSLAMRPFDLSEMPSNLGMLLRVGVEIGLAIALPAMVFWMSLTVGMRVRSQLRSLSGSLIRCVGWLLVLPWVALVVFEIIGTGASRGAGEQAMLWLSPLALLGVAQSRPSTLEEAFNPLSACALVFLYAFLWSALRARCLMLADKHLRTQGPG